MELFSEIIFLYKTRSTIHSTETKISTLKKKKVTYERKDALTKLCVKKDHQT